MGRNTGEPFGSNMRSQLKERGWTAWSQESRMPHIGRLILGADEALAGIYSYVQEQSKTALQVPSPFLAALYPNNYIQYKTEHPETILETLSEHPLHQSDMVGSPMACSVIGTRLRNKAGQKGTIDFQLTVRDEDSAQYGFFDERAMLLRHIGAHKAAQQTPARLAITLAKVSGIQCSHEDFVRNAPELPDSLTLGPLQLIPYSAPVPLAAPPRT